MNNASTTRPGRHVATALAIALLACAGHASAQHNGFYIGASVGQAQSDFDFRSQVRVLRVEDQLAVTRASIVDDKDGAYKLTLGYAVTPQLAVELDYVDLGTISTSYELSGIGRFTRVGRYEIDGFNISGVFSHPINDQWSIFGRAGVLYSNYKYSETGENFPAFTPSPIPPVHSFTAADLKRAKPSFGLGVDYKWHPSMSVRFSWDRYTDIGNDIAQTETGNGKIDNIDFVSLGLVYRF